MKNFSLLFFEAILSALLVFLGLSGTKFLWITSPKSAAITLSVIGIMLCMVSIGTFISAGPAHPLTIIGYMFGVILLAAMVAQIFSVNIPFVSKPETALVVIGACIIIKGFIARFPESLVTK